MEIAHERTILFDGVSNEKTVRKSKLLEETAKYPDICVMGKIGNVNYHQEDFMRDKTYQRINVE